MIEKIIGATLRGLIAIGGAISISLGLLVFVAVVFGGGSPTWARILFVVLAVWYILAEYFGEERDDNGDN